MTFSRGAITAIILGFLSLVPDIQELFGLTQAAYEGCKVVILPVIGKAAALMAVVIALYSKSIRGDR